MFCKHLFKVDYTGLFGMFTVVIKLPVNLFPSLKFFCCWIIF